MTCSSTTIFSTRAARLAVALAAALIGAAPAQAGDPRVEALRRQVAQALARRDPIAAEVPVREAIRQGVPADAVRAMLAEALMARGDLTEARKVLWGGDFTPESAALGWRVRGQLEMARGNLAAAGQAFDRALRADPDDADLWAEIAALRFAGGEHALAIDAAARAVQADPRNVRALAVRGMLIREQYGLAASLPWFEAALRVRPDEPALLGEYAATLGDMGQYRAMLVVCRKLVEVDPKSQRALFLQAVLAARAGQTALARAILQRTGTTFRDTPAAMLLNGVLEYRAGNVNLAVEQFDRLVRLQPDNLQARQLLARALARQGDWRQVASRFDTDARAGYATPYMLTLVGQAWQRLGAKPLATTYFQRAQAAGPLRGAAPIVAGAPLAVLAARYQDGPNFAANAVPYVRGLLAAGQKDEAQAVADRLRDANPGAVEANLLSGDVRMIRGDAAHALIDYGNGASIRFNEPVLKRMDAALRAAGRAGDADAMTSRFLAQNPASVPAMKLLAESWRANGPNPAYPALAAALAARGQ